MWGGFFHAINHSMNIKEDIRQKVLELGFDVCRFTVPPANFSEDLKAWIEKGYHGTMEWMAENPDVRGNPQGMWPEMRTIIAVGKNYAPKQNPLPELADKDSGYISVYARGDDYHDSMKKSLKKLGNYLAQTYQTELKVFVDTAPVMEKPLAAQAGVGWQGKHTVLVSREFGGYLFLGSVYMTLEVEPDEPETNHCGNCTRCQDICPTKAFPKPYQLDARKCISYLTIEHKGSIPVEYRKAMGNRIYGCDDCVAICPWNKFAQEASDIRFHHRESLDDAALAKFLQLDDASFRELFKKSPVKRIGGERFLRNVLVASGNSKNKELNKYIKPLLKYKNPVVAEAAAWALGELNN